MQWNIENLCSVSSFIQQHRTPTLLYCPALSYMKASSYVFPPFRMGFKDCQSEGQMSNMCLPTQDY